MKNGTSAFNKMNWADNQASYNLNKKEGSVEQRAEGIMDKVKEEIKGSKEKEKYTPRAEELLNEYGSSDEIPQEELERDLGKLDDGKLLAYIKYTEEERARRKETLEIKIKQTFCRSLFYFYLKFQNNVFHIFKIFGNHNLLADFAGAFEVFDVPEKMFFEFGRVG